MSRELKAVLFGAAVVGALVSLVLLVTPATERAPRYIHIGSNSWPPFISSDLPSDGPLADLVRRALLRGGYDARIVFYPTWEEALSQADSRQISGAFPLIRASDREQFLFSRPLCWFDYGFFYKKAPHRPEEDDLGEIRSKEELASRRIGTLAGYTFWKEMEDLRDVVAQRYASAEDAFRALQRGEVDFFAEGRLAGEHELYSPDNDFDPAHYGFLGGPESAWLGGSRQRLYLLSRKTEVRDAFDRGLIHAVGELDLRYDEEDPPDCGSYLASSDREQLPLVLGSDEEPITAVDPVTRERVLVPRGTGAVSLAWSASYRGASASTTGPLDPGLCRVKLLNGPLRGRVLELGCDELRIETAGEAARP